MSVIAISMGILYLIGRISHYLLAEEKDLPAFREFKNQLTLLRNSGRKNWREESMRLIRHNRFDDPKIELQRLKYMDVLTLKAENTLEEAQNRVRLEGGVEMTPDKRQNIKILYAQAMEIKKIYKDDYYVFLHAQASPWIVVTYLVKALWRKANPHANLHQFKPLRAPCSTAQAGLVETLYQKFNYVIGARGAAQYSERWLSSLTLSDNDHKVREDLLSCDLFFGNASRYESALHFLTNNVNILQGTDVIKQITRMATLHFLPHLSETQTETFVDRIVEEASSLRFPCGNLFTICIPKNYPNLKSLFYRAHPFGVKCGCHPEEEDIAIANKLQGDTLDELTKCQTFFTRMKLTPAVPQYRIFLPHLHRDSEESHLIKTFLLSPLHRHKRKSLKRTIQSIVNGLRDRLKITDTLLEGKIDSPLEDFSS